MKLITTTDELAAFCKGPWPVPSSLRSTPSSCARRTFFPKLCLIQIADSDEAAAIDPLAGA